MNNIFESISSLLDNATVVPGLFNVPFVSIETEGMNTMQLALLIAFLDSNDMEYKLENTIIKVNKEDYNKITS